uniref:Family with sequence similarity 160 member B2 n=1 Tax=Mastacembelus armatus TaxID=205130 RepID=A0A7N8X9L6_9TELE
MEAFSRLTSMLLHALETREPTVDLLESFVDHWKSITRYYIETTDDSRPVRHTDIPWHLKQMLDILVFEEKQQETGACMEYLLQHKVLETLCTLGKAQYPPGMSQQVLLFFSKLLSQMQKPLLHLVNVYRPVQKLIHLCALPGSKTEKEEAQFLLAVCSKLKQEPHTLRYVLEVTSHVMLCCVALLMLFCHHVLWRCCRVVVVLSAFCCVSPQRAAVCVKAHESLLLLSSLQAGCSGEVLSAQTQLGTLLAGRLLELYSLLSVESLDPGQVQSWPHTTWRYVYTLPSIAESAGFDLCMCQQVLAVTLAQCVHQLWLVDVLQPQLLQTCEQVVLVSTSILCAAVRLVQSSSLLDQMIHFVLRTHTLTHLLLQRCDHISDQISLVSLSLVEELLQKPHRDILDVLVLCFLQSRSYLSPQASGVDDTHTETEDSECLLVHKVSLLMFICVCSFLCLVPVQVRSAQLLQEGGYESYIHDAHTLVTQCESLSQPWDWPLSVPPHSSSGEGAEFFEGHLLKVLFDRLGRILEQPYELNLQLTAVLSRLSAFNHPLLHEYLLNPYIHLSHCSRSLFSVLVRVMGEMMQRMQQVSNLTDRLLNTRRHLLGLNLSTGLEHLTLLRGVIVLEEFCKELAAVAFVKLPLDQN